MTDFALPASYDGIREEALALALPLAARVEPRAAEADGANVLDERIHLALKESGLCEFSVPAAFGGRSPDVDPVAICVIREVLMAMSSHLEARGLARTSAWFSGKLLPARNTEAGLRISFARHSEERDWVCRRARPSRDAERRREEHKFRRPKLRRSSPERLHIGVV